MRKQINHKITIEEYNINVKDDHDINLIYYDKKDKNKNLLIYSHGNAENIKSHMNIFYNFGKYASIILFDYTGYGKSTGEPTMASVCDDIYNIWLFATNVLGYKPKNIILQGFSLGGAVVSHLVYQLYKQDGELPKAIILQSTFTSIRKIAKWFLPRWLYNLTKYFIDNTFNSIEYLQALNNKLKIMIVHSKEDQMIDYEHAELFVKNLNCDHIVINGDHNNGQLTDEFWLTFRSYL